MKVLLLIVLCGAMLLDGCYSYAVLETGDEKQQLPPDKEDVRITLIDGSVIESEAYHHVEITVPSNCIYGAGTWQKRFQDKDQKYMKYLYTGLMDPTLFDSSKYIGRIDASLIDSSKGWEYGGVRYRGYWLKDGSRLHFKEGNYIIVTPDQGTGLLCIGRKTDVWPGTAFANKVNLSEVKSIEVEKLSTGKTKWFGVLLGAAVGLVAAIPIISALHTASGTEAGLIIPIPLLGALAGWIVGAIVAAGGN